MIYGSPEKPSEGRLMEASGEAGLMDNGGSGTARTTEGSDRQTGEVKNRPFGVDGKYC